MAQRIPKPKMWGAPEKSVKQKSLDNEERLVGEIGFETTRGSGNTSWASQKGDGSHPEIMFELKESEKTRIGIGVRDITKLVREARAIGKEPSIVLSAYGLPEPLPKEWVCVTKEMFIELLLAYDQKRGYR